MLRGRIGLEPKLVARPEKRYFLSHTFLAVGTRALYDPAHEPRTIFALRCGNARAHSTECANINKQGLGVTRRPGGGSANYRVRKRSRGLQVQVG
jgi:hypothetical protein